MTANGRFLPIVIHLRDRPLLGGKQPVARCDFQRNDGRESTRSQLPGYPQNLDSIAKIPLPACDGGVCVATDLCCPVDVNGDYSGSCIEKDNVKFWDGAQQTCSFADDGITFWLDETFYCRDYTNEWIFNIGDFVDVLFDVKNNGSYNINLRFYPLPLQESKVKP